LYDGHERSHSKIMPTPKRRRGGQPGNQNARKHGLYCQKPAPAPRPRGGQPGNLNALLHGRDSRLLSPAPYHRPVPPFRPALRYRSDLQPAGPSVHSRPPAWLDLRLAELETRLMPPIEDPLCSYEDLIIDLEYLEAALNLLVDDLSQFFPDHPQPPERKLP
jgi:hypothetical protein